MPIVVSPPPGGTPDTTELEATAPPQALPAYQDDSGTGANGPKYDSGEFWSGVARNSLPGRLVTDVRAAEAAGYNPLLPGGKPVDHPEDLIPPDQKLNADQYVGLYTPEEIAYRTFQLRQKQWDDRHGGQSKWAGLANMATGLVDPIGMGSMFVAPELAAGRAVNALNLGIIGAGTTALDAETLHGLDPSRDPSVSGSDVASGSLGMAAFALAPALGASRLSNAVKMGLVGGGSQAVFQSAMATIDPDWNAISALQNVSAGTLLSGVLGGIIRPHVSATEYERLRAHLREDLHAPSPEPAAAPSGDTAQAVAADIRTAIETHAQGLSEAAQAAQAAAAHLDPQEVATRLKAAQEALSAAPAEQAPEARDAAIAAEVERLKSGNGVLERLQAQHGENLDAVLRERAEQAASAQDAQQQASRANLQQQLEAAQADQLKIDTARTASQMHQDFAKTIPNGYTDGEGEPNGIRPENGPQSRPDLSADEVARGDGGAVSAKPIPERSAGGSARRGEGGGPRAGQPAGEGRANRLGDTISRAPAVETAVRTQLARAGRTDPATARTYAALVGDFYATQAERFGMSADELYIKHPLRITGELEPAAARFRQGGGDQGIDVSERAMTPEEEKLFAGLRAMTPAREPFVVHRGATKPLGPEDFEDRALGHSTGHPSSGLGVFFTNRAESAPRYGPVVSQHHLDLRNPYRMNIEDIPAFDSVADAIKWRQKLQAEGHDGIILNGSHVGHESYFVAFSHDRVLPAGNATGVAEGRSTKSVGKRKMADPYTQDLFGHALPEAPRETRTPETPSAQGDVPKTGKLSRDDLPPGRYARHTEIVKDSERQLGIDRVTNPDEAAEAFAGLARGGKERFDALVTDKDGKPLAIVGSSVGAHAEASVFPAIVSAEAHRIEGAAHIWFGHNHPSGNPTLSGADHMITDRLNKTFAGTQIKVEGIHAISGGAEPAGRQWSHYDPNTGDLHVGVTKGHGTRMTVPVVERLFTQHGDLGPPIESARAAVQAAKDIAGDRSGIILSDARYTPVGFVEMDAKQMAKLKGTDMIGAVHRAISGTNANTAFIVNNGKVAAKEVENLAHFLQNADLRTLDIIDTDKGTTYTGTGQSLPQGTNFKQGERGSYNPETSTIALGKAADLSTFLHEAGHHFLDLFSQLAARPDAPLGLRSDMQSLLDWFKVKNLKEWHGLGVEGQRDAHEQFAQGFEQYLKDGVAPSTRLQGAFDSFREWLSQIYKGLVNHLRGEVPDDIRSVMDRMIATNEEIKAARAARVAAAPTPIQARVAGDTPLQQELRYMADRETGWGQEGGKMIRHELNGGRGNEFDITRTQWIPNSDWWPGRPGSYNPEEVKAIVEKAIAGERLGPQQAKLIEYMTEVADQRVATEHYLPNPQELLTSDLTERTDDAFEAGMVARLGTIDEGIVETLARQFEDDHAGFMAKVKEILDAHDTDAKLARSVPQDPSPVGLVDHGGTAGRPAAEASPRGEPTAERSPAAERPAEPAAETARPATDVAEPTAAELLARLPPEVAAPLQARLEALESPKHVPLYAAPGDSTAGASSVVDRASELHDYSLARGGRVLGKALGWFAPGSRALRSPSLAMRKTIARLVETPEMLEMNVPSAARPFGAATPIPVQTLLKRWEGQWAQAFAARDKLFREMRARPMKQGEDETLFGRSGRAAKLHFNELVSMALRRQDASMVPEVQRAAQLTRKLVFDPLKLEAQKLGLLPADDAQMLKGTADSYLMRQYDRAKIQKDQRGWHQTLVDGFAEQGVDPAEASDIAHAVTRNILGTELGLLDGDNSVFNKVPTSGRLQGRTLKLPDRALEPYLVNDIDTLSHSYLKSLAPQVEMLKMFRDDLRSDGLDLSPQGSRVFKPATPDPTTQPSGADLRNLKGPAKDITDEYSILKQRALVDGDNEKANKLDRRLRSDLRDLATIRDRLYGIDGAPSDSSSWIQRAGRMIRSVNALRLLGTATWSHVPDLANIVMKRGLPQTMAMAAKLSTSLEALNMNREQMHRVGTVLDMIHNTTAAALGEFGVESNYAVQKALNRATRAFTIATLETPWIATCKALAGAAAHDEVLDAATRAARFTQGLGPDLSKNERIRFNQMGLDQHALERIAGQFKQHGQTVNGIRFGMSDRWDDKGAAQMLDAVTNSAAEASTLSPGAGDTPRWTSGEVGKAIFQFKTFGAVAIRRVTIPLAQGLAHADLRSAQGLATLVAAGALTYTMKQLLSGQPIEKDPGRYALEVLDKSNLLGWTGEYFYPSLWQFGAGNFSRWGDRQTWETLGGPVAGTAVDAWDLRLPAKLIGTVRGDTQGPRISRSDIHRIRRMLPGNQVWYLRRAVNAAEGHIGDSMGLPPAPVAGSTE